MRRSKRMFFVVLAGGLSLSAACSLFTDLSDLSTPNTADASGLAETAPPALDGTVLTDASPGGDGESADATPPPPPFRCADITPAPAFCDDFDDGTQLGYRWSNVVNFRGTVAFDTVSSPTRSIRSISSDGGFGSGLNAVVELNKGLTPANDVELAFDIRINEITSKEIFLGQLDVGPSAIYLLVSNSTGEILERTVTDAGADRNIKHKLAYIPKSLNWSRFSMRVRTQGASAATVSATLDGRPALEVLADPSFGPGVVTAHVGITYLGFPYAPSADVNIDNVVVTIR